MSAETFPKGIITGPARPRDESRGPTRLSGRRLALARGAWLIVVSVTVLLYLVSRPISFEQSRTVCRVPPCQPGQLTPADVQRLQQQGVSVDLVAGYYAATDVLFALVFLGVALIIFWRKSDEWMALLVALMLVTFSIATFSDSLGTIAASYPVLAPVTGLISQIGTLSLFLFFFLFPDGRFAPRWTRWLFLFILALGVAGVIWPDFPLGGDGLGALVGLASILLVQIYRYWKVSGPQERQQTKWVVFGATAAFGLFGSMLLVLTLAGVNPEGSRTPSVFLSMFVNAALRVSLALIPLSLLIAILRYRLWEIDLLINRTLVYAPLTAILAGIFAASITLSQKLFIALTGQSSDAATVLTTLVVVAAFDPLKNGLQHLVDRRFKESPDPAKSWKTYGEQVREFVQLVDVEANVRRFLEQAVGAFEARGGAVSLYRNGQSPLVQTAGDWNGEANVTIPLVVRKGAARVGLLELGSRRDGRGYSAQELANLQATAELVASLVLLTEGINGAKG